jgi:hypothetical protein
MGVSLAPKRKTIKYTVIKVHPIGIVDLCFYIDVRVPQSIFLG